jgi:mannose-6-phosphate isomerase-like protein (cupin superfamily)
MESKTSPKVVAAALTELWSPRIVAELDDSYVKVAKIRGTFVWHTHDDEDELFFILQGRLRIEIENGEPIDLAEGGSWFPRACGICRLRRRNAS